ncbi:prolyl oligopeptidase family serine peptidase [Botrimarina sp.]|uniref:alpha/beta hydrolase family protein n=1 Tax=Botrimarina sp. TaxID=2795802 RepID=UPI0032EEB851
MGDDTRDRGWGEKFAEVWISSSQDATEQPAYVYWSAASDPAPLVVSLHSWSGDYKQHDPLAELCAAAEWNYIHPDFRSANNRPEACASRAALADIDDAISYAIDNGTVDESFVYLVGGSGGGHACCAASLTSKHDIRASYAWVPITDIAAWYHQTADRDLRYAADIEAVLAGVDDFYEAARERSPLYMPLPLRTGALHVFAGVRDGYDGSVPISHSLGLFNRLCRELGEPDAAVDEGELIALLTRDLREPVGKLGDRAVWLRRDTGFGSLTIFDGAHELLHEVCFDLIVDDYRSGSN